MKPHFFLSFLLLTGVYGQSCKNDGIQNGSSCACPVGWGGSDCSNPSCGSNLFSSNRPIATSHSNGFPNLTASACACETDWTGLGCNVCETSNACQAAFTASGHSPSSSSTIGSDTGINSTLVCNRAAQVRASGQMSCNVLNPTLQAIYPRSSILNIMLTLDPSLSPIPNTTSFGSAGTVFAQLFYDGVEQFYCSANSCVQTITNINTGNSSYTCQNLQCSCIAGTSFCGGSGSNTLDLTNIVNGLGGSLTVDCDGVDNSTHQTACRFEQSTLQSVFGSSGLPLSGCTFGECVAQSVLDQATSSNSTSTDTGNHLSGGVIAGLAVVGALILLALAFLLFGFIMQRKARRAGYTSLGGARVGINWSNVTYVVASSSGGWFGKPKSSGYTDDKVILDCVSGSLTPGQMMAILGPSGAGKTTLVEILARKHKSGTVSGSVTYPSSSSSAELRIGFVPQQDILPPMLTVYESLLFAARLRLPEGVSDSEKREKVDRLIGQLGLQDVRDTRIGDGRTRGISGGEMRRVSIGLELIASPDILILDEPTSGLDSVSASRVANLLHSIAHDAENPTAVIASIHQPSSQLYHTFDSILVLSHGRTVYSGKGGFTPAEHLQSIDGVQKYPQGYNVADYLLEVASDPPLVVFQQKQIPTHLEESEKASGIPSEKSSASSAAAPSPPRRFRSRYAATFLTQLEYLSGREWKILRRDKTLFFTHLAVAAVLGVFCGGLYFQTGITIAGFQSRVGCLFFLGALIAFSSLSALYNVVEIRPLFLRERSSAYYSPTVWLLARFIFDAVPLRIIPTIVVSTITYWMAGLAHDPAHFFKFLFILVLYTLAMTLFNFLLGTLFNNGGIAILLSALSALYQMTFAGFFVHLDSIPPVLRWLQWLCPLKYCLEALSVNEVGSGLMIKDTLQGVPISVSAELIMNLLFGFGPNNYYRDVLILFGFIAGFGLGVIAVVWVKVRERR